MTKSASLVVVLSKADKEIEGFLCPVRGSVQAEQKEAEEKTKAVNCLSWWAVLDVFVLWPDGARCKKPANMSYCICLYGPAESRNVELTLFLQSCALSIFDSRNWTRRRRHARRFRTSFSTANLMKSHFFVAHPVCVFFLEQSPHRSSN